MKEKDLNKQGLSRKVAIKMSVGTVLLGLIFVALMVKFGDSFVTVGLLGAIPALAITFLVAKGLYYAMLTVLGGKAFSDFVESLLSKFSSEKQALIRTVGTWLATGIVIGLTVFLIGVFLSLSPALQLLGSILAFVILVETTYIVAYPATITIYNGFIGLYFFFGPAYRRVSATVKNTLGIEQKNELEEKGVSDLPSKEDTHAQDTFQLKSRFEPVFYDEKSNPSDLHNTLHRAQSSPGLVSGASD